MGGVKMNLVELVKVTSSEEEAEKFVGAKGFLKKPLTAVPIRHCIFKFISKVEGKER
jgi:hypothetical protein